MEESSYGGDALPQTAQWSGRNKGWGGASSPLHSPRPPPGSAVRATGCASVRALWQDGRWHWNERRMAPQSLTVAAAAVPK